MTSGTQYLSNLSNPVFNNTTITHVSGNAYNSSWSERSDSSRPERYGLRLLLDNVCRGAFHNAAERGDPPRCHPHTRMAIREEIMEWIQAPAALCKLILWMYGPAGSGKTAIAQTIAEECAMQDLLAASFFFGRVAAGRNDTSQFVATIAFQLSQSIPQICEQIISRIEQNPMIFSLALTVQMQVLIIDPLKSLPPSPKPIFLITDGVDECGPNRESHTVLLNALGIAISELRNIPLKFLIASRPEFEIREAFNGDYLSPLVKSLVLDDTYKPDEDIRLYLDNTFKEIHALHLRLDSRFPSVWPAKHDIDYLVSKASGQFIFVDTVMRFVRSPRHHPPERLDIILGLSAPGNETPFALLDTLYLFILSSATDLSKVMKIFTVLLFGGSPAGVKLTVEVIESLLGFTVSTVLLDMHALLFVPPGRDSELLIRIHHASLYDFFTDRSRSKEYYIDARLAHIALSQQWLKLMTNYPLIPVSLSLKNCVEGFVRHYNKLLTRSSEIEGGLAMFNLKKLLYKIGSYEDLHRTEWGDLIDCVEKNAGTQADVFPRLRDEFDAFVFERLSQYPQTLQAVIPVILVHSSQEHNSSRECVFHISLYDPYPSTAVLDKERGADPTLLGIWNSNLGDRPRFWGYGSAFKTLFRNRSRAGQFYVDGTSYLTLAKQIIKLIYPMLRSTKYRASFFHTSTSVFDYLADQRYDNILKAASEDLELALLLRELTLQYHSKRFCKELRMVAEASLAYIKRCGIPYKKHIHPPNTNKCIICESGHAEMSLGMPNSRLRRSPTLDRLAFMMRRYIKHSL